MSKQISEISRAESEAASDGVNNEKQVQTQNKIKTKKTKRQV